MMMSLPMDAEPLGVPNMYVTVNTDHPHHGYEFFLVKDRDGRLTSSNVCVVRMPEPPRWRVPLPYELMSKINVYGANSATANDVRAAAEIMMMAATFQEALDESLGDALKAAEEAAARRRAEEEEYRRKRIAEREEYARKQALERKRLNARQSHIYELIKWQLGEKIKLTRDGKRATVFGTIDHVDERGMHITTEKGKFMSIMLRDINKLWIKEGHARRYDVLYTAGDEPDPTTEEENKEVTHDTSNQPIR